MEDWKMKTFTSYYHFYKDDKSKTRLNCVASTENYLPFELLRSTREQRETPKRSKIKIGDLLVYLTDRPEKFRQSWKSASKSITAKDGTNLSSIYTIGNKPTNVVLGYGDFHNTSDGLIFIIKDVQTENGYIQKGGSIEVYVAPKQAFHIKDICSMVAKGAYNAEFEHLRRNAR